MPEQLTKRESIEKVKVRKICGNKDVTVLGVQCCTLCVVIMFQPDVNVYNCIFTSPTPPSHPHTVDA